jgi:hypothetical protein
MTITWASVGGTIGSNETPKSAMKSSFRIEHLLVTIDAPSGAEEAQRGVPGWVTGKQHDLRTRRQADSPL